LNLAPIHDHEHVTHCFEYLRLVSSHPIKKHVLKLINL
jgi:hypothetical protein